MIRQKILSHMTNYLKSHNIPYTKDLYNGAIRLTILYEGYENCPDKCLESCLFFYNNVLEARVYYTETGSNWCKKSNHVDVLMRLFNYINATLWPCVKDGAEGSLYKTSYLHTPRLYMTEDGYCDITLTTIINYDFYEMAPLETEDYITAACPDLLNSLSPAIFGIILGTIDLNSAINYIKKLN